ncbi:putative uncharacterized protein DDB_G0289963 [Ptychodera flava]|uniref:putative uncharacterized protein DDB_G0289963 n=1 Tax=Ptychodera flava TaxID=63121 RepID=UPI003969E5F5
MASASQVFRGLTRKHGLKCSSVEGVRVETYVEEIAKITGPGNIIAASRVNDRSHKSNCPGSETIVEKENAKDNQEKPSQKDDYNIENATDMVDENEYAMMENIQRYGTPVIDNEVANNDKSDDIRDNVHDESSVTTTDKNTDGKRNNKTQSDTGDKDVSIILPTNDSSKSISKESDTLPKINNGDTSIENADEMETDNKENPRANDKKSTNEKALPTETLPVDKENFSVEERVLTPPSPFPPSPTFSPASDYTTSSDSQQPISVQLSDSSLPGPSTLFSEETSFSQDLFATPRQEDDHDETTSMTSELSDISQTFENNPPPRNTYVGK